MTKIKRCKLLNNRFKIVYKDSVIDEEGNWIFGRCVHCGSDATLEISTKDADGNQMDLETIEVTVRHELFHLILDSLYFTELSSNETLVEWLATATYELHKQGLSI